MFIPIAEIWSVCFIFKRILLENIQKNNLCLYLLIVSYKFISKGDNHTSIHTGKKSPENSRQMSKMVKIKQNLCIRS